MNQTQTPQLEIGHFMYWVDEWSLDPERGYRPSIVVEDTAGHFPNGGGETEPWYWGFDLEAARAIAHRRNAAMGVSIEDEQRIMESSMVAQNRAQEPAQATYAWTITVDHSDGEFCSTGQIGPEYPPLTVDQIKNHPDRKRFRMLDDDGELYVEGVLVDLDGSCTLFEPLDDYGECSLGCTSIEYCGPGFKGPCPGNDWERI